MHLHFYINSSGVEYGSESGCVWNMALRMGCVESGSVSGGVWNKALRVDVCGIWL